MKLIKSLLLGAAAGVVGVATASAADLPSKVIKGSVEYVKICDTYGTGYFYIPGTDTCLKVFGTVRAEYRFFNIGKTFTSTGANTGTTGTSRSQNATQFHSRVTIREDSRTQTGYGVLRTLGIIQADTRNSTNTNPGAVVDKGFIQWAGITAGRYQSFFDFYADDSDYIDLRDSDLSADGIAYTAAFGGGFSATVSIEDPVARRGAINSLNGFSTSGLNGPVTTSYAGTRAPDVVGVLRVDQTWGSAQLSAAAHQIVTQNSTSIASTTIGRNTYGFGVQGGVQINLPMLGAGDKLWLQAAYAKGALDYIGVGNSNGSTSAGIGNAAGVVINHGDAVAIGTYSTAGALTDYKLEKESGFSALVSLDHYWTPTIRQAFLASYAQVTAGSIAKSVDWRLGGLNKWQEYRVGTVIEWSPVKGFIIGVEGIYNRVNNTLAGQNGAAPTTTTIVTGGVTNNFKKEYDQFEGRLRLNRSF